MLVTLTLDYRTLHGQVAFHLPSACWPCSVYVLFFGTTQMGARRWIFSRCSTCSRRSSPRWASRSCSPSSSGEKGGEPRVDRSGDRGRPHASFRWDSSRRNRISAQPSRWCWCSSPSYLAGMRLRILGVIFLAIVLTAPAAWMFAPSRIRNSGFRLFSIRRRTRKARATSRFRPASPSDRAD